MDIKRIKYPRTMHLPSSPGATSDDKMLSSTSHFDAVEVVVTEKMDGENSTMYANGYTHARSLDSKSHPSRDHLKALAARVGMDLPEGWRVCGENVYAKHSIGYDSLPAHFMVFSIWDENNNCLSWDETVEWCELLGLHTVPVLYRGKFDADAIHAAFINKGGSEFGGIAEGYVVRIAGGFAYGAFSESVAKWVRPNHVQTDTHWMHQTVTPNKLKDN